MLTDTDADRLKYDSDDRKRCVCAEHARWTWGKGATDSKGHCLNSTRHPSGKCTDCRNADAARVR